MSEFPPIPEWINRPHYPYQSFAYTEDDWYPNFPDADGDKNLVVVSVVPMGQVKNPNIIDYYNVLVSGADDTVMILSLQEKDSAIQMAKWIASDVISRDFLKKIGVRYD